MDTYIVGRAGPTLRSTRVGHKQFKIVRDAAGGELGEVDVVEGEARRADAERVTQPPVRRIAVHRLWPAT